jgi:D-lactate dehydrogenase (cytochrome)
MFSFARWQISGKNLLSWIHRESRCQNTHRLSSSIIGILSDALPSLHISTNAYDLQSHGRGESYHKTANPYAVVFPTSEQDIIQIVKICSENNIPIIPYGAGTSVEGHIPAIHGGISLDMKHFDFIHVNECDGIITDPIAKVGAGVNRKRLNHQLRHTGFHFVVDPGADATIGGMAACGASGTTAVKYGTMKDNVLALEFILPDGTFVKSGTNAFKNSAGYDLTSLMIGSEGTLGIITSVTVKLHPIPEHVVNAVSVFSSLFSAAEAVVQMKQSGIQMSRCELLDQSSMSAYNKYNHSAQSQGMLGMEEKPTLFLEFDGLTRNAVFEHVNVARKICVQDFMASDFRFTSEEKERHSIWAARHQLYYAAIRYRTGATSAIVTDACVPLSKFATLMAETAEDVKKYNVVGPCFGHAGDGNFHCILPLRDDDSDEYISRLHTIHNNLILRTLEAGGTCTGEHGVGYGKIKYLPQQYGEGYMNMMKSIKQSLDPKNIMNPGKILEL